MFYETLKNKKVRCKLCPRHCIISEGKRGFCKVRENQDCKLFALNYGKLVSMNVDPIEKKPLHHFYPGDETLSIATAGCNMSCKFCQNWEISQKGPEEVPYQDLTPERVVRAATENGLGHISYTYTEPTIFFEFAYDTAKLAHEEGIKNSFVSNGYIEKEPLEKIAPYLDAMNMDFKMVSSQDYKNYCGADAFAAVKSTAKRVHDLGIHLEVTTLLIPGLNDNLMEFTKIVDYIAALNPEIPFHISRFFPHYKMKDKKPTAPERLQKAAELARRKLSYVYIGNVPEAENTFCPDCNTLLIKRFGYSIVSCDLDRDKCPKCGRKINIRI